MLGESERPNTIDVSLKNRSSKRDGLWPHFVVELAGMQLLQIAAD